MTALCCHGSISVPETWLKFTNDNIERSRSERKASSDLRALAKETLDNCAAALLHQWHATNDALTERVRQYTEAKHKLQNHLSKVYELISFHPFLSCTRYSTPTCYTVIVWDAADYFDRGNDANSGDVCEYAGVARDIWSGEDYRIVEEVHPWQGGSHDGGTDTTGYSGTPPQHGSLPWSRTTQVSDPVTLKRIDGFLRWKKIYIAKVN